MIIVNLLPHELRPVKHSPLPYLASAGVLVLAVLVMLSMFLAVQGQIMGMNNDLNARKAELKALEETVRKYNQIIDTKEALQDKITIIKEILSGRIIWSEQLNTLAKITPDNIWYSRIRVTQQTVKMQQVKTDPKTKEPVIDKRTGRPQMETKSVPQDILEVSGYVTNDAQGERQITPLLDATTQDKEFSAKFDLQQPKTDPAEFKGFAVQEFTLRYLIESGEEG